MIEQKNILITGTTGFVGGHLARHYLEKKYTVVGIEHDYHPLTTAKLLKIDDKIHWCHGEITNLELLRRIISDYDISEIIHTAAMSIERGGFRSTLPYFTTNVIGTINILDAMKEQIDNGFDIKLLHFSTDKIYGNIGNIEYKETQQSIPNSIYSCSKACADIIVQTYISIFDLPITILRSPNIFGFGDLNSRVIPNTIDDCLNNKSPNIYSDLNSIREYIYIDDVCNAVERILENMIITKGNIYNIGSNDIRTQEECVLEILKYFPKINPTYSQSPNYAKKELPYQKMNSEKIFNDLKWKAKTSFEIGISNIIKKYKKV